MKLKREHYSVPEVGGGSVQVHSNTDSIHTKTSHYIALHR